MCLDARTVFLSLLVYLVLSSLKLSNTFHPLVVLRSIPMI